MPCTITNLAPLGRPCTPQMGGVKNVYLMAAPATGLDIMIAERSGDLISVMPWSYTDPESRNLGWAFHGESEGAYVSSIGELRTLAESLTVQSVLYPFYRIEVTRQGAVVTSEATVNRDNGTAFYRNAVTIPTVGLTPGATHLLTELARGGCIVVAEMWNGQMVAFGFDVRATLDAATLTTGANWGDMPGANITLAAEENVPVLTDLYLSSDEGMNLAGPSTELVKIFKEYFVIAA